MQTPSKREATPSGERLWDRWRRHRDADPSREAVVHYCAEQTPVRWTFGALIEAACAARAWLAESGVERGEVCGLVLRHHPSFYPLYLGVSALGAIPAVLAFPNARLHPDKFVQGLRGMSRHSGLDRILTERELEPIVRPLVQGSDSTVRGLLFPFEAAGFPHEKVTADRCAAEAEVQGGADDPCLLQHSSGTTGLQKAVMLTHRAVLEHARRYGEAIGLGPADKIVSWLPLYHDMGLIAAFHLPLACGVPVVQMDPFEWVGAPYLLFEAISSERATITWLPNFAYNLCADRVRDEDIEGVRLDGMRLFVNCSEPVRAASHQKFLARFEGIGLRPEALGACYAMAETTFALTQTRAGARARELTVARDELARGRAVPATGGVAERVCVSSGVPISGCEVRVVGDAGATLPEGSVGELRARSVSLFDGYRNDPETTRAAMEDGWYRTGDLGFVFEGEVYVVGRQKDLLIVAGKNLYPEDIEDAVSGVPGILPGRVVAFGVDDEEIGTEVVCVVAETDVVGDEARNALGIEVRRAGMGIDVTIARVYLAPPRWLVKSSSGKPSRRANKERVLAGELASR